MKGTIACIVAVCSLALASGAAVNSASQVKIYTNNEGEVIHSLTPFWNDELLYAVCDKVKGVKNCKVYMESSDPAKSTVQTCEVKLNYTDRFDFNVLLTNAGNSKAVFAEREGETKIKLLNVDLKGCTVHEAIVEVTLDRYGYIFSSVVVPHLDGTKYDFFYRNEQLCHDLFCRATFDYEGKLLKAATPFPVHFSESLIQIAYDNGAYIVAQNEGSSGNVIFVKEDGNQLNHTILLRGNRGNDFFFGFSTAANRFGFCSINDGKVVCQQYDVEGKKKLVEHTFQKDAFADSIRYLDVLNLEKGFLLAVSVGNLKDNYQITIAHVDEQGKEGKVVTVDNECHDRIGITKLYKAANGEYCINFICMPTFDTSDRSQFTRLNRCFLQTELF